MSPGKPSRIVKPTLDTKFHIDYEWWERKSEDLRSYLLTHLPSDERERFINTTVERIVDYIDPDTGEVFRVNELGLAIQEASKEPDFINPQTSMVDSVFRVFLSNGNIPQSPRELGEKTDREPSTILRTLGGIKVYRGIRPYTSSE